jgi:Co/Zn/Cd efflux system component
MATCRRSSADDKGSGAVRRRTDGDFKEEFQAAHDVVSDSDPLFSSRAPLILSTVDRRRRMPGGPGPSPAPEHRTPCLWAACLWRPEPSIGSSWPLRRVGSVIRSDRLIEIDCYSAQHATDMTEHSPHRVGELRQSDQRSQLGGRPALVQKAILLSVVSVVWGLGIGTWSITAGLLAGSLGVLGLGLDVVADVVGSASLVWRFRRERSDPHDAEGAEARASVVVVAALLLTASVLVVASVQALIAGTAPDDSVSAMSSAGLSALVLIPLAIVKHRVGTQLSSSALKGDGTLSGIGASLGVLALVGLLTNRYLGWWGADRVAALGAALIALVEARRVLRYRPRGERHIACDHRRRYTSRR